MSQQGRILLSKCIKWLDGHLMLKDKCHVFITISSAPSSWPCSCFHYLCIVTNFRLWSIVCVQLWCIYLGRCPSLSSQTQLYPDNTQMLFRGENRSVWCVGDSSPVVDVSVRTYPWVLLCACVEQVCTANTFASNCNDIHGISTVLLIDLSYYMSSATSVHRIIASGASESEVYMAPLLHCSSYSGYPRCTYSMSLLLARVGFTQH